jgi:thioesterase domain-containing protein
MNAAELERYLHANIPLSRAMQVAVLDIGPEAAVLAAPLAPNINHRETVFGGSAAALATLAAWALLHVRLHAAGAACRIVIARSAMDYRAPLEGDFTARSVLRDPEQWERSLKLLQRRGRARIAVDAVVAHAGDPAAWFEGEFAALAMPSTGS